MTENLEIESFEQLENFVNTPVSFEETVGKLISREENNSTRKYTYEIPEVEAGLQEKVAQAVKRQLSETPGTTQTQVSDFIVQVIKIARRTGFQKDFDYGFGNGIFEPELISSILKIVQDGTFNTLQLEYIASAGIFDSLDFRYESDLILEMAPELIILLMEGEITFNYGAWDQLRAEKDPEILTSEDKIQDLQTKLLSNKGGLALAQVKRLSLIADYTYTDSRVLMGVLETLESDNSENQDMKYSDSKITEDLFIISALEGRANHSSFRPGGSRLKTVIQLLKDHPLKTLGQESYTESRIDRIRALLSLGITLEVSYITELMRPDRLDEKKESLDKYLFHESFEELIQNKKLQYATATVGRLYDYRVDLPALQSLSDFISEDIDSYSISAKLAVLQELGGIVGGNLNGFHQVNSLIGLASRLDGESGLQILRSEPFKNYLSTLEPLLKSEWTLSEVSSAIELYKSEAKRKIISNPDNINLLKLAHLKYFHLGEQMVEGLSELSRIPNAKDILADLAEIAPINFGDSHYSTKVFSTLWAISRNSDILTPFLDALKSVYAKVKDASLHFSIEDVALVLSKVEDGTFAQWNDSLTSELINRVSLAHSTNAQEYERASLSMISAYIDITPGQREVMWDLYREFEPPEKETPIAGASFNSKISINFIPKYDFTTKKLSDIQDVEELSKEKINNPTKYDYLIRSLALSRYKLTNYGMISPKNILDLIRLPEDDMKARLTVFAQIDISKFPSDLLEYEISDNIANWLEFLLDSNNLFFFNSLVEQKVDVLLTSTSFDSFSTLAARNGSGEDIVALVRVAAGLIKTSRPESNGIFNILTEISSIQQLEEIHKNYSDLSQTGDPALELKMFPKISNLIKDGYRDTFEQLRSTGLNLSPIDDSGIILALKERSLSNPNILTDLASLVEQLTTESIKLNSSLLLITFLLTYNGNGIEKVLLQVKSLSEEVSIFDEENSTVIKAEKPITLENQKELLAEGIGYYNSILLPRNNSFSEEERKFMRLTILGSEVANELALAEQELIDMTSKMDVDDYILTVYGLNGIALYHSTRYVQDNSLANAITSKHGIKVMGKEMNVGAYVGENPADYDGNEQNTVVVSTRSVARAHSSIGIDHFGDDGYIAYADKDRGEVARVLARSTSNPMALSDSSGLVGYQPMLFQVVLDSHLRSSGLLDKINQKIIDYQERSENKTPGLIKIHQSLKSGKYSETSILGAKDYYLDLYSRVDILGDEQAREILRLIDMSLDGFENGELSINPGYIIELLKEYTLGVDVTEESLFKLLREDPIENSENLVDVLDKFIRRQQRSEFKNVFESIRGTRKSLTEQLNEDPTQNVRNLVKELTPEPASPGKKRESEEYKGFADIISFLVQADRQIESNPNLNIAATELLLLIRSISIGGTGLNDAATIRKASELVTEIKMGCLRDVWQTLQQKTDTTGIKVLAAGSVARAESTSVSDIDYLVVIEPEYAGDEVALNRANNVNIEIANLLESTYGVGPDLSGIIQIPSKDVPKDQVAEMILDEVVMRKLFDAVDIEDSTDINDSLDFMRKSILEYYETQITEYDALLQNGEDIKTTSEDFDAASFGIVSSLSHFDKMWKVASSQLLNGDALRDFKHEIQRVISFNLIGIFVRHKALFENEQIPATTTGKFELLNKVGLVSDEDLEKIKSFMTYIYRWRFRADLTSMLHLGYATDLSLVKDELMVDPMMMTMGERQEFATGVEVFNRIFLVQE